MFIWIEKKKDWMDFVRSKNIFQTIGMNDN